MPKKILFLTGLLLLATVGQSFAMTAPTAGFAQSFYDIVVIDMLQGPIGFVAGIALVILGAAMLPRGAYVPAALTVATGGVVINAASIVESLGMML
jgi:type IV secretory pathway VirB2 component (pilin)